jgi:S-DNA-T family DNA segregation ATPase FtsK/SpoIIIE
MMKDSIYDAWAKLGPFDPISDLPDYQIPGIDLLKGYDADVAQLGEDELRTNKNRITQVLSNHGIEITSISATIGLTITLYEIVPAPGVKISKIKSLEDDMALSLSAAGIRIIVPISGKGTVGIEVPNKNPQIVSMRSVINSKTFQKCKYELPVAFGKTITNSVFMIDLAKMPHLLVAGMEQSSVLDVLIISLLYKKYPSQLKFVLVDTREVDFTTYAKIEKHYLAKLPGLSKSIVTDLDKVVPTLDSLTTEMNNRYLLLHDAKARNIKEYNAKYVSCELDSAKDVCHGLHHRFMPYIVVIIDEYRDLLTVKDMELSIVRIAQLARAVGIHMVIATHHPSAKVITGMIKANFPARLAFRVASGTDSKTILDATGAQNLIGRGDFLFSQGGTDITRVQCAFVDTPEVQKINDFIGDQQGYPEAFRLPEYVDADGTVVGGSEVDTKSLDPKLKEAAELVVSSQNGSTSNIQRTLSLGFNRAGRIMDQLEAIGIVGPVNGSKPREVLVDNFDVLERIFDNLNK